MWGRKVIEAGIRWRAGNGQKILVHKDNWLPRPSTFKPMTPPRMHITTVVADLIKAGNKWDEDKLKQQFMQEDIEMIFNILLRVAISWHLIFIVQRHPAAQETTQGTGIPYGLLRFLKKSKYSCGGPLGICCHQLKICGKGKFCRSQVVKDAKGMWNLFIMH